MLEICLLLIFLSFFLLILGVNPIDTRPTLKMDMIAPGAGKGKKEKKSSDYYDDLRAKLSQIRQAFGQDSVAWALAETHFI